MLVACFSRIRTFRNQGALRIHVRRHRALSRLFVTANEFDAKGTTALAEALRMNTALTTLNLSGNTVSSACICIVWDL